MNKLTTNSLTKARRLLAVALMGFAAVLTISGLMAQSPARRGRPPQHGVWSKDNSNVIDAFSNCLTRAGKDAAFRSQLTASAASAKAAVKGELHKLAGDENTVIPLKVFIMFYEPEARRKSMEGSLVQEHAKFFHGRSNQNYHIFYLPPADGAPHVYKDHLMCCYEPWKPPVRP